MNLDVSDYHPEICGFFERMSFMSIEGFYGSSQWCQNRNARYFR